PVESGLKGSGRRIAGPKEVGSMTVRRRVPLFAALVATAVVLTGAMAFACTNLATLNLSSASGKPGDSIIVTGSSFRMPANVTTGVQLRWNALDGPVLAEATPDKAGNFSTTVTIPDAQPDVYVLVAVLRDAKGADTSGTPARAQFQVIGGAGKPVPAAAGGQVVSGSATGTSSTTPVPLALLFGLRALGLGSFLAGALAVARLAR